MGYVLLDHNNFKDMELDATFFFNFSVLFCIKSMSWFTKQGLFWFSRYCWMQDERTMSVIFQHLKKEKYITFPFFSPGTEAKPAILSSVNQQPYRVMTSSFLKHIHSSIHIFFQEKKLHYQVCNSRGIAFHFITSEFLLFQMGSF